MKKFSSFHRVFNQYPAIFAQHNVTNREENIDSEQNSETTDISSNAAKTYQEAKSLDENIQSNEKIFYHYPQSDYDTITQSKTQNEQNIDKVSSQTEDIQYESKKELSHKAKCLLECMRQHDNVIRKIQK